MKSHNPTVLTVCERTQIRLMFKVKWTNTEIENTDQPKYLGVTLDHTLSYKQHIHNTKMKVATHQTDTACAWLVCLSQEGLCKLYPPILPLRGCGPLFFGESQSCDPAAWLAETQLLAVDIESNPGQQTHTAICH